MGYSKRKMEDQRRQAAEKEAATRRATDAQVLEDAERLIDDTLDGHRDAAVNSLIPALSCRSCRPTVPFAELVRLSWTSIADEMHEGHRRRVLGRGEVSANFLPNLRRARSFSRWSIVTVTLLLVGPAALAQTDYPLPGQPPMSQPTTTQPVPWGRAAALSGNGANGKLSAVALTA